MSSANSQTSSEDSDDGDKLSFPLFASVKDWIKEKLSTTSQLALHRRKSPVGILCPTKSDKFNKKDCSQKSVGPELSDYSTKQESDCMSTNQQLSNQRPDLPECLQVSFDSQPDSVRSEDSSLGSLGSDNYQDFIWRTKIKNWLGVTQSEWTKLATAQSKVPPNQESCGSAGWSTVSSQEDVKLKRDSSPAPTQSSAILEASSLVDGSAETNEKCNTEDQENSVVSCGLKSEPHTTVATEDTNGSSSVSSAGTARDIHQMRSVSDFPSEMTKGQMNALLLDNNQRIANIKRNEKTREKLRKRTGHRLKVRGQTAGRRSRANSKWFRSWSALFALKNVSSTQGNDHSSSIHQNDRRIAGSPTFRRLSRSSESLSRPFNRGDQDLSSSTLGFKLDFIPLSSPFSSLWLSQDLWALDVECNSESSSRMPTLAKKFRHKKPRTPAEYRIERI